MKPISIAIIFIIIILPFLFITSQQSEIAKEDSMLRTFYDSVIDNAVQDAAIMLSLRAGQLTYGENIDNSSLKNLVVNDFFDSLYYAFNVYGNKTLMARIEAYVPVLIYLEWDGFSLYAIKSFKNEQGYTEVRHCWIPKKHYIGEVLHDRYSIRYTLSDHVYIYDQESSSFSQGDYYSFKDIIPSFNDQQLFNNLKLGSIKRSIEKEFEMYLEEYRNLAGSRSLSVDLKFPSIDHDDWKRALEDQGLLVFAQGFPVLQGQKYEHYALGCARIIRKGILVGYQYDNRSLYCKTTCEFYREEAENHPEFDSENIIYFNNAYEAAAEGFYPCPVCRP